MTDNRDQTMIIFKRALQDTGLSDEDADRVVSRAESNTDIIKRLELIEPQLEEMLGLYQTGKKWAKGFVTLILGNYGIDLAQGTGLMQLLVEASGG